MGKYIYAKRMEGIMINEELKLYVEKNILPIYNTFDKAHDENHVRQVIANSLEIAQEYDLDKNIIFAAAAYHDLGLQIERAKHEEYSRDIMLKDKELDKYFNQEEKEIIADAILTHRASCKTVPKTIYGKVIADADNDLDPYRIIERMVMYSLDHYKDLDRKGHLDRCFEHGHEKYGHQGYLKLYLDSEVNKKNLSQVRKWLDEEKEFIRIFDECFEKHS